MNWTENVKGQFWLWRPTPVWLHRTRWAEVSTRRRPTSASSPTWTSGTGNFPSARSTTWQPATAKHWPGTFSPGQRATLKYLAEPPNGPLSRAVRLTELQLLFPGEKKKMEASLYFWAFLVPVIRLRLFWVIDKLNSAIYVLLRYSLSKATFLTFHGGNDFTPAWRSSQHLQSSPPILGCSVESPPELFVWLISSWTSSRQPAPYV